MKFWNFLKILTFCFAIWLADWKWNLVSGWTTLKHQIDKFTIDKNRHKPEYTSREVYSLWGRVEKMLFKPIRKKRNSLLFNQTNDTTNIFDCYCKYLLWAIAELTKLGDQEGTLGYPITNQLKKKKNPWHLPCNVILLSGIAINSFAKIK